MRYLKVATRGVADVESFTVLGASTSREKETAIGQFGSGAKHAILCALRSKTKMLIYCGNVKIEPRTQPQVINGTLQQRLEFRIGNRTETSSMVLDFGSIDWDNPVPMMLREVFSNALDAVDGKWDRISLSYSDKPRASSQTTQVYIELTPAVENYLADLHKNFLHVNAEQDQKCLAQNPMPCRFYRLGVFVHEVSKSIALYSYNCGSELPIDESRKLDTYRVASLAAKVLCQDEKALLHVVSTLDDDTEYYEHDFSSWYLDSTKVQDAFREKYGSDVVVTDNAVTFNRCQTKGINIVMVKQNGWFKACTEGGEKPIATGVSKLTVAEENGLVLMPASKTLLSNITTVHELLVRFAMVSEGLLDGVKLVEFEKPLSASESLNGFYVPETRVLAIQRDHVANWKVLVEEMAHVATEANDFTRDFQDYAFRLAALALHRVDTLENE